MSMNKSIGASIIALTLATSLQGDAPIEQQVTTPTIVPEGKAAYSQGELVSYGFSFCSAVVFDYGDAASFAHAVPVLEEHLTGSQTSLITTRSAVKYLLGEAERLGKNHEQIEAHISAGDQVSLNTIIQDLKVEDIKIASADLRNKKGYIPHARDSRTITYSPSKNKLEVFLAKDYPEYRTLYLGFRRKQE